MACKYSGAFRALRARSRRAYNARAAARCIFHNKKVAMLAWDWCAPLAVVVGISKLTWGLYVPVHPRNAQRAGARALYYPQS